MNGSDLREQEDRADTFAWHLSQFLTDGPGKAVVLDALACSGLMLVPDEEGVCSATLFTRVWDLDLKGSRAA